MQEHKTYYEKTDAKVRSDNGSFFLDLVSGEWF